MFRKIKQNSGEIIDNFVSRHRQADFGCQFTSQDEKMLTQISINRNLIDFMKKK